MPPKPKPRKYEQPFRQIPSGHDSRRNNPTESSGDSIREISENKKEALEELEKGGLSNLEMALSLLDIFELTPNQAKYFRLKIETMRIKETQQSTKTDSSTIKVDDIECAFNDLLISPQVWICETNKYSKQRPDLQDVSLDSDVDTTCVAACYSKPTSIVDDIEKFNDKNVTNLLKRIMEHIRQRRKREKKKSVTKDEVLLTLYIQTDLVLKKHLMKLEEYFGKNETAATIRETNRNTMQKMLSETKITDLRTPPPPTHPVVYCSRLFNLFSKLMLMLLKEVNDTDGKAIVDILKGKEKQKDNKAAAKTSNIPDPPFYRQLDNKREVRAEIERHLSNDDTLSDVPDLPCSYIPSEGSVKSCSADDSKPVLSNEGGKRKDSTDVEDDLDLEAESLSTGKRVPQKTAGDVVKETLQPNESELLSPSKGLSRRDRSPLPGESPLKKANK